jgi:alkylated DNA repair dioxygenase AlkB
MEMNRNTDNEKLVMEKVTCRPRVWDCHAGNNYPANAVYVGCRVTHPFKGYVIREGTIFGNGTNPLVSHKGAVHSEGEFRALAIEKLKDSAFRTEADKLRGKDLLCWCVQEGKQRAEFCHARVWLELMNNFQGELTSAPPESSTEQRRDFDWGYYEPNFLTNAEADALFEMAKAQPRIRPKIERSGYFLRRCASMCWSVRDRHAESIPLVVRLEDAPPEILALQRKLSDLAGKEVNYFSLQAYENERDHIGFHQHREDKCRDARVFIISLGERRSFAVDMLCPECLLCNACNQRRCHPDGPRCCSYSKCQATKKHRATCAVRKQTKTVLQPGHGSLIFLTSEANDWYEHAVLDDKEPKGLRISINTKCIPTADAAVGYVPRELRRAGGFVQQAL